MSDPAITIENLLKSFEDVTAVDGISLQVRSIRGKDGTLASIPLPKKQFMSAR